MNFNFKMSRRDFGMGMGGFVICAIVLIPPLLKRNKELSEKNDDLVEGFEQVKIALDDSEEERAKLYVENRHKDDELKRKNDEIEYLRNENQFLRDNFNVNKTSDPIL